VDQVVTAQTPLAAVPSSVREARHLLAEVAREHQLSSDVVSIAELALSEVVTNAVVHGGPPIVLRIDVGNGHLRVDVADGNAARPRADGTRLDATGGRGLAIVAAVAGDWGVEPGANGGKSVWFIVAT
jgi:anti-sigma regulatory factor (Ser/Thr protein kinase)